MDAPRAYGDAVRAYAGRRMLLEHRGYALGALVATHHPDFPCFHPDSDETDVIHSVPRLRRHHQL